MDIYLFSGTHWDREWYQSFQGFRVRLVKMMDEMIERLETDEQFGVFHLDGQTIVLDDYLDIMPQNKGRLESLIKSGKLLIGPWYCMPDEFLLSGESLIKNLQLGYKKSREYGAEPLKYGYICDIFGHIAQMPQIFKSIGIYHALVGRGTNEHTTAMHFNWESPDGSRVTTFKLADRNGYASFPAEVLDRADQSEHIPEEVLTSRIKKLVDYEIARSNVPLALIMDAIDHAPLHRETGKFLRIMKELYSDFNIHHTSVMEMCEKLEQYQSTLPVKSGELNETAKNRCDYLRLLTHVLSSRYPLKKSNDRVQTLLEKWVQPMYAFGLTNLPEAYLNLANEYLLKNHPHDSICGCSIDQVHKDMVYRFDQAELICNEIVEEFSLSHREEGDERILKIFNPLPYSDSRVIEAALEFENGFCKAGFKLLDSEGNEIPYGIADIKKSHLKRLYNQVTALMDIYTVVFKADLKPMSFTEYKIVEENTPVRYMDLMKQDERTVENAFIALTVNDNGSINIKDKQCEREYTGLLTAIDNGEVGDGWMHHGPEIDRVITNTAATVEKVESGASRVTFKITQKMLLPEEIVTRHGVQKRGDSYADFEIVHFVSVGADEKWVSVKTKISNNIKEHRLKLRLPTAIKGDEYYANQPFCFVKRSTGIDEATLCWSEPEAYEKQTGGIVVKKDEKGGFAFVSQYGLHECAVSEGGDIDITLFRSYSRTVMTNGETGGQLLEDMEFSYILMPFDSEVSFADLQKRQDFLQGGVLWVNSGKSGFTGKPLLEIQSENILLSTAGKIDGGLEVRVYNMSDREDTALLKFGLAISNAFEVDLDGNILKEISVHNNCVSIACGKWQFKTLRITVD